jgi:hypothetical protein
VKHVGIRIPHIDKHKSLHVDNKNMKVPTSTKKLKHTKLSLHLKTHKQRHAMKFENYKE